MVRTFGQETRRGAGPVTRVPVINGLTDLLHPCQVLADLQTVYAHFARRAPAAQRRGGTAGADVLPCCAGSHAWIGDGNNMANSWIEAAGILGLDLALACPPGYEPDANILARARATGRGASPLRRDPREAVAGRQVISTDVFASMGQEAEAEERRRAFAGFMRRLRLAGGRGARCHRPALPARSPG